MTITNSLRKGVHRKAWEYCTPAPVASAAGALLVGAKMGRSEFTTRMYYFQPNPSGGTAPLGYRYDWTEDGWQQITMPSSSSFNLSVNSAAIFTPLSPNKITSSGAGTTSSFSASTNPVFNATGCKIRCVSGTGIGYEGTIQSNNYTKLNNATFNVTPASLVAFDSTSVFQLWTGAIWISGFGATGSPTNSFMVYDCLAGSWTAKASPTSYGVLVATPSIDYTFYTGTATDANSTTTLDDSGAASNWAASCWINYQVRITGGTGVGQVRTISANTTTQLTVSSAWTTTPDTTSTYAIEGNDDYIYNIPPASGTLVARYSISANTWTSIGASGRSSSTTPSLGTGMTADWIAGSTDSQWTTPALGASNNKQNGRYIYCFRGNSSSILDLYDITTSSWFSGSIGFGVSYASTGEVFSAGTTSWSVDDKIYIQNGYGRFFKFDCTASELFPLATTPFPIGTPLTGGCKHAVIKYIEGTKELRFLFSLHNAQTTFTRMLLV